MKFGKEIQSQQIPGWSQFYLDYKALKKIISAANKSLTESSIYPDDVVSASDALLSAQIPNVSPIPIAGLPTDATAPLSVPVVGKEEERGPEFQRSKALFFFKLERELEKINAFYLQKEAELKLRLETLLSKRRAAAQRLPAETEDSSPTVGGAEWRAVEEGFRLLDKDLVKLQKFIEINATGFRKILKKWDKRSRSRTKELYLARQVEVQPCFNRQLLAELSDTVTACLLDPTNDTSTDTNQSASAGDGVFRQQLFLEGTVYHRRTFRDFEANFSEAIERNDESAVSELLSLAESSILAQEHGRTHIMRILWRAAIQAVPRVADMIIASKPFDLAFVDDINGRTSLHEAAIAGEPRLVDLCLNRGIDPNGIDAYGRSALHYACMHGHDGVSQKLLVAGANPNVLDMDNDTPLICAVVSGRLSCAKTLISSGEVSVGPTPSTSALVPLSLAAQYGHRDVALLLIHNGAQSVPNTNGEYPIHLAAREGHADLCHLLVRQEGSFQDMPDKYNEWTPLFHAARRGHDECVRALLEAGCNPLVTDELGKTAVHYAAWFGHVKCVNRLLQSMSSFAPSRFSVSSSNIIGSGSVSSKSPTSDVVISPLDPASMGGTDFDLDVDVIPSLSLPPPIMPFRIYGHNYLDKMHLVQVALGHPFSSTASPSSPVYLLPSMIGRDAYGFQKPASRAVTPSIKLVMTSRPVDTSTGAIVASHSIVLPLEDETETFTFRLKDLSDITLEFSFYPTFGSKPIGRAVASPHALRDLRMGNARTIPILDHRLHVIGHVLFDIFVVTPFSEVALEIGGTVETYWKSTVMPISDLLSAGGGSSPATRVTTSHSPSSRSPGASNAASVVSTNPNGVTMSSLSGDFIHVVVQVTRDLIPVIFPEWNLPVENGNFDIGVADVTVRQFENLGNRLGKTVINSGEGNPASARDWWRLISGKLITLEKLLMLLPVTYGVSLELRYPNKVIRNRYHLGHNHEPNEFVDAILKTVYSVSRSLAPGAPRRKIVFSSFVPTICTAVNWKQPNYAVFFASKCGVTRGTPSSSNGASLTPDDEESDTRCRSVGAAVQFAKSNNLLGVLLNANLLSRVPSLVQGIKVHGLLLAAFGTSYQNTTLENPTLESKSDVARIDAFLHDGVLSYVDHSFGAG